MAIAPDFIRKNEALAEAYTQTNITFAQFSEIVLRLGNLKMINISSQTIVEWFKEIIMLGYTREKILKQADKIKNAKIFGAIDFAMWTDTDLIVLLPETEINKRVENRINSIISRGEQLYRKFTEEGVKPSEPEERTMKLAALRRFEQWLDSEKEELLQNLKDAEIEKLKAISKDKNEKFNSLNEKQRGLFVDAMEVQGYIKIETEADRYLFLNHFKAYEDAIPTDTFYKAYNIFKDSK